MESSEGQRGISYVGQAKDSEGFQTWDREGFQMWDSEEFQTWDRRQTERDFRLGNARDFRRGTCEGQRGISDVELARSFRSGTGEMTWRPIFSTTRCPNSSLSAQ